MNKREFLKKTALLGGAAFVAPALLESCSTAAAGEPLSKTLAQTDAVGKFIQTPLGYGYAALEPHVDAMTMEVHYSKHHAGYTAKFNKALEHADLHSTDIRKLFAETQKHGAGIRNNGGGYYNHNLYWKVMSPDGGGSPEAGSKLSQAINESFGSFEEFQKLFSTAAATTFGSGWAWLIRKEDGSLAVSSTPNQDNPLMDVAETRGTPLLNIDVWEHAYYLHYQNKRKAYIEAFWNVIDWKFVGGLYDEAEG